MKEILKLVYTIEKSCTTIIKSDVCKDNPGLKSTMILIRSAARVLPEKLKNELGDING